MKPGTSLLSSCGAGDNGSTCNQLALTAIGQARRARRADERRVVLTAGVPAAHARPAVVRRGEPRAHRARAAPGGGAEQVPDRGGAGRGAGGPRPGDGERAAAPARRRPGRLCGRDLVGGWVNALGADYAWMYDDGPSGSNLACRTGSSRYCWGHRDVLLTSFGPRSCHGSQAEVAMGTGHAGRAAGYGESDTVLVTGVCGPVPADAIFTWVKARELLGIR